MSFKIERLLKKNNMATAQEINRLFREKGFTLGSVESFTGGKFASEIVSIPGASHFYKGGFVTYTNEEKNRLLGISWDDIDKYGVISQEMAGLMASHARALLNVDFCVSFTGNAGPDVMEGKKAGEVYIGISYQDKCQVFAYQFAGSREEVQKQALETSFSLLLQIIF